MEHTQLAKRRSRFINLKVLGSAADRHADSEWHISVGMTSFNLLVVLLALVASAIGQMNFELGKRLPDDEYYCSERVFKNRNFLAVIVGADFVCKVSNNYVINKVKVTNYASDRAGASVTNILGGPGWQQVALTFRSKWLYGIDSFVEVWAVNRTLVPVGFAASVLHGNPRPLLSFAPQLN